MQITAELDNQHIEKLKNLEKNLNENTSELISFALDEIYYGQKPVHLSEGQKACQLMQKTGFIASIEGDRNLSENHKQHLNWTHKI